MGIPWRIWTRKWHRWGAILIALPFLLVLVTGIMLQLKKEWNWVQPPTAKGSNKKPSLSFDAILKAAASHPEAGLATWDDVARIDVQPSRGIAKVQGKNRWEVQVDTETGDVLHAAYRRSDLIESLHDGSWFHDAAKLWVFLPTAAIVLMLWFTGIYLFFLPLRVKWGRKRPAA